MKVTKLHSTSIAAVLLSTTLLTGVASAANTTQPAATNTEATNTPAAPTALENLEKAIVAANTEVNLSKGQLGETNEVYKNLVAAITSADALKVKKDATEAELIAETKTLAERTASSRDARLAKVAETEKLRSDAKAALNKEIDVKISTASKPTKLVADYSAKKKAAISVYGDGKSSTTDFDNARTALVNARTAVESALKVIKVPTGADGKITVNFKTLDGKTDFPKSTGKLTSTGVATAEKDTDYIEVYDLRDLVKKYNLTLPRGYEINNPDKIPTNTDEVTNIDLKSTPGYQYDEALVTFTLKRDGQVISSTIPNFTVLQETGVENQYADVTNRLNNDQLNDIKAYYLKAGYIVDPATTKYTFNKDNFYQTAEINFIKKPVEKSTLDGPGFTSFNNFKFNAGQKYTVRGYLELYDQIGGNFQLDNKDYNVEVYKVTKNGKSIKFNGQKFSFPTVGNYIVKTKVTNPNGGKIIDAKGKARNALYFSNTATVVDSAPVISGIKNTTYSRKTFSYTKDITAYDYVDKKYVKVTYKSYINFKKSGKYKVYYYAKDSKGNTSTKVRYVSIR